MAGDLEVQYELIELPADKKRDEQEPELDGVADITDGIPRIGHIRIIASCPARLYDYCHITIMWTAAA